MDILACYFYTPIKIACYSWLGVVVSSSQAISSWFNWVAVKAVLDY